MDSTKEILLREAYNYKGPYLTEDLVSSNFVKGLLEDYEYFGENTANIYEALFMLNGEAHQLLESYSELRSLTDKTKKPFLFEELLNEVDARVMSAPKTYTNDELSALFNSSPEQKRNAETMFNNVLKAGSAEDALEALKSGEASILKGTKSVEPSRGITRTEQLDKMDSVSKAGGKKVLPSPERAETPIVSQGSPAVSQAASMATNMAIHQGSSAAINKVASGGAGQAALKGGSKILELIKGAFGKVKNFFSGNITSIGSAIKTGKWASLLSLPLVQGALAVGGAVLAFKVLKKIFGKKIKPEQEEQLKTALQKGAK